MRVPVTVLSVVTLIAIGVLAGLMLTAGQAGVPGQTPVLLAQAGRGGQAAAPAIPRASDGKPDFSGIWQVLDNSTNGNVEPHQASYGVRAGQGAIVDPPNGLIPYLPAALAKRQENFKKRAQDPVAYCWKPGVPRITYIPFPFQITQSPKWMQITYEFVHSHRNVYMNDSPHLRGIDFYNGDSRARWEGDSLVVDVKNINDDPTRPTWFDSVGKLPQRSTARRGAIHIQWPGSHCLPGDYGRPQGFLAALDD